MIELLNKLNNINFEELDIDEFLNKRDIEPFDSNWVRVYQIIEEMKKGRAIDSTKDIEKKVYIIVYEQTGNNELAGYISDDFGLIADSKILGYTEEWLEKFISCYENSLLPCGVL